MLAIGTRLRPAAPLLGPVRGGFTANSANMSRTTTILGLLQTILLVGGFLALGMVLKVSGYPDSTEVRWNPLAVFLREHGGWLLLLPVLWVLYATTAQTRDHGFFSYRLACAIGLGLAVCTIAVFLYAAVYPFTRPFFYSVP